MTKNHLDTVSPARKILFPILSIGLVLGAFLGIDMLLGCLGVHDHYRDNTPDRLHRKDPNLLYIERSNLNVTFPIFSSLVAMGKKEEAYVNWEVTTNARGMNERDFTDKKADGVTRIICFGDSCTFGWGVKREQTYVSLLQKQLHNERPHPSVEVLNAGHTGFSSFQGLEYFKRYAQFWEPDIVTFCYAINDYHHPNIEVADKILHQHNRKLINRAIHVLERSNLYLAGYRFFRHFNPEDTSFKTGKMNVHRVSLSDYEYNLTELVKLSRFRGATPILITQPHQLWSETAEQYRSTMLRVAERNSVSVIDCARYFADLQKEYGITRQVPNRLFIDSIHPQPEGYEIMATMIEDTISTHLKKSN